MKQEMSVSIFFLLNKLYLTVVLIYCVMSVLREQEVIQCANMLNCPKRTACISFTLVQLLNFSHGENKAIPLTAKWSQDPEECVSSKATFRCTPLMWFIWSCGGRPKNIMLVIHEIGLSDSWALAMSNDVTMLMLRLSVMYADLSRHTRSLTCTLPSW